MSGRNCVVQTLSGVIDVFKQLRHIFGLGNLVGVAFARIFRDIAPPRCHGRPRSLTSRPGTEHGRAVTFIGCDQAPGAAAAGVARSGSQKVFRMKQFVSVALFDGDLNRFSYRADRIQSMVARVHPVCGSLFQWAESQPEPITEECRGERGRVRCQRGVCVGVSMMSSWRRRVPDSDKSAVLEVAQAGPRDIVGRRPSGAASDVPEARQVHVDAGPRLSDGPCC